MSGIGFSELIILFLIGLIVLGPERLPRVANQVGTWLGQARRMTRVMKRQLEEELDLEKGPSIKPPPPAKKTFPPKSVQDLDADSHDAVAPANELDDTYSPAHAPDDIGTGVGDSPVVETADETTPTADDESTPEPEDAKEKVS